MDECNLPLELELAIDKADKLNERAIASADFGASDLALQVTKGHIGSLTDHITDILKQPRSANVGSEAAIWIIGQLPAEIIALCALSVCLNGVAQGYTSTEIFLEAGQQIAAECWANGLTKHDPKLAARIEQDARKSGGHVKYRRQAARSIAKREGYKVKRWTVDRYVQAGSWMINSVIEHLPHVFEWVLEGDIDNTNYRLRLSDNAFSTAQEAAAECAARYPVYQPTEHMPAPWTDWRARHGDKRLTHTLTLIRSHHADVGAAVRAAIRDGSMKPALDGVNALQSVPYRINKKMLAIVQYCIDNDIAVAGIPGDDVSEPPKPRPWEAMVSLERAQWRMKAHDAVMRNYALRSDRLMLDVDMQTAKRIAEFPQFYTWMNCDWRGRVYAVPHFNFAREDRVRALFEFANGEPIGEEGIRWLKIHVANCGAFDKIDKRPLNERVQWVDDNMGLITRNAIAPSVHTEWTCADNPFLFLAACMELMAALAEGSTFITHLPVSFDGSCSGLQHLSAIARDEHTAALVNLIPSELPQDVYATVADLLKTNVQADVTATHYRIDKKSKEEIEDPCIPKIAQMLLNYGIDRKITKRNVMTFSYSSKKFGMSSQQQTDLMDVLKNEVLEGKREDHPFDPFHKGTVEKPGKAARYIGGRVYDAIEQCIHGPAHTMKFLQSIARALAHEGKPARWVTPVGLPWINRYHEPIRMKLRLWLWDRGVKTPVRSIVTTGEHHAIAKDRAANGVSPNLVHACDAAHLLLAVNASVAAGITEIATVHDSFGCLASRATEFNKIIREQFIAMYERHDILSEVLEQACRDLTHDNHNRLPTVPQIGNLNLKEIQNAQFAFA